VTFGYCLFDKRAKPRGDGDKIHCRIRRLNVASRSEYCFLTVHTMNDSPLKHQCFLKSNWCNWKVIIIVKSIVTGNTYMDNKSMILSQVRQWKAMELHLRDLKVSQDLTHFPLMCWQGQRHVNCTSLLMTANQNLPRKTVMQQYHWHIRLFSCHHLIVHHQKNNASILLSG
jgi:hypothetical protein